jgi:hypothetical protein
MSWSIETRGRASEVARRVHADASDDPGFSRAREFILRELETWPASSDVELNAYGHGAVDSSRSSQVLMRAVEPAGDPEQKVV